MDRSRPHSLVILVGLFLAGAGASCAQSGREAAATRVDKYTGALMVRASAGVEDVDAIRTVVVAPGASCDAEPTVSKTAKLEDESPPTGLQPSGAGSDRRFADSLFVLPPGSYKVCATPLAADGTASKVCGRAEGAGMVIAESTAEVLLVSQCQGKPTGGLDSAVVLNKPPQIDDLMLEPSKFITTCETATITVRASDPNGDQLTYAWSIVKAPPSATATVSPAGNPATFTPGAAGVYSVKAVVTDVYGAPASLTFPIYVSEGAPGCMSGGTPGGPPDAGGEPEVAPPALDGGLPPAPQCEDGDPCTKGVLTDTKECVQLPAFGSTCSEAAPAPVRITDVRFLDGRLQRNGPARVAVTLQAPAARDDYPFALMIFPADDTAVDEVPALALGGGRVAQVPAGMSEQIVEVTIPSEATPGRYELTAMEHPEGQPVESSSHPEPYDIADDIGLPLLGISDIIEGNPAMLVDATGVLDPLVLDLPLGDAFTSTIELTSHGHAAAAVPLRAMLIPASGSPVPLHLWDATQKRYVDHLVVDALAADTPTVIGLELAPLAPDAEQIRAGLTPGVPLMGRIEVSINVDRAVTEGPCLEGNADGSLCVHAVNFPVALFVPVAPTADGMTSQPEKIAAAPSAEISGGESGKRLAVPLLLAAELTPPGGPATALPTNRAPLQYRKTYDRVYQAGSMLGGRIFYDGQAELGRNGFFGQLVAKASWSGRLPGIKTSFGGDLVDVKASARAQLDHDAELSLDARFFGKTVHSYLFAGKRVVLAQDTIPLLAKEQVFFTASFVVVVVPVTIEVGGRVSAQIDLTRTAFASAGAISAGIEESVAPNFAASAFGSASISLGSTLSRLGFSLGEVRLDVDVLKAQATYRVGGLLDVTLAPDNRPLYLTGSLTKKLDYQWGFGSGRIKAEVAYPSVKMCKIKKPFKIKIPCGIEKKTAAKTVEWPGKVMGPYVLLERNTPVFQIRLGDPGDPGCQPSTSACAGRQCGTAADGCGGMVDCGTCANGRCTASGTCEPCANNSGENCACGGVVQCDGSCSSSPPPNLGARCDSECATVQCDGTCSGACAEQVLFGPVEGFAFIGAGRRGKCQDDVFTYDMPPEILLGPPQGSFGLPLSPGATQIGAVRITGTSFDDARGFSVEILPTKIVVRTGICRPSGNGKGAEMRFNVQVVRPKPRPECGNNICEVAVESRESCPNDCVPAGCPDVACRSCVSGYADCDNDRSNGCETRIGEITGVCLWCDGGQLRQCINDTDFPLSCADTGQSC